MPNDALTNLTKERSRPGAHRVLDAALATASVAAVACLVLLHGWRGDHPLWSADGGSAARWWDSLLGLSRQQVLVLGLLMLAGAFAADRFARLASADRSGGYFRQRWVDFALAAVAFPSMAAACLIDHSLSVHALWIVIAQLYILFSLLLRGASVGLILLNRMHPAWLALGGMLVLCLGGAGLLMLPGAAAPNAARLWFHDALFTAISAATLTGLSVRPVGTNFSFFGQFVIGCLIQFGGLVVMMFGTAVARQLGRQLCGSGTDVPRSTGVSPMQRRPSNKTSTPEETSATRHDRHGQDARATGWTALASFVVAVVVVVELVGAVLLWPMFVDQSDALGRPLGPGGAVWYAVFHSVSAFCNAGVGLYADSLRSFREHAQVLGVIAPLIVLGGIGLPVIQELLALARTLPGRLARARRRGLPIRFKTLFRLSLHGKMVLWTTLLLLFFGTTTLLLVETIGMNVTSVEPGRNFGAAAEARTEFQSMTPAQRLRACGFLSVASRTGGFRTSEVSQLSDAGKALLCVLMGVGGSPGSAAGGVKTVTFAVLVVAVVAGLGRRGRPHMFGRTVAGEWVQRCLGLAGLYVGLVGAVSILLAVAVRSHGRFMDLFFETVSACSNVGLSSGATANLTDPGKFILMFAMLAGRLAPLIFLLIVTKPLKRFPVYGRRA